MAAAPRIKTADKQALVKKLLPLAKKHYKTPAIESYPVLETMLFATCIENVPTEEGMRIYNRMLERYPDFNEARVSSVNELVEVFGPGEENEWKAYRVRGALQHVFDKNYSFEFEGIKKKTLELAVKQLAKFKQSTSFVRGYVLYAVMGAHHLPLDDRSLHLLTWLGLVTPDLSADDMAESLKSVVKKSEIETVLDAVRAIATDPKIYKAFDPAFVVAPEGGYDPTDAVDRLSEVYKLGGDAWVERHHKQLVAAGIPLPSAKPKAKSSSRKSAPKVESEPVAEKAPVPVAAEKTASSKSADKASSEKPSSEKTASDTKGASKKEAAPASEKNSTKAADAPAKASKTAPAKEARSSAREEVAPTAARKSGAKAAEKSAEKTSSKDAAARKSAPAKAVEKPAKTAASTKADKATKTAKPAAKSSKSGASVKGNPVKTEKKAPKKKS